MLQHILWQQNARVADECLHHPFVRGLANGTLDPETFKRYVAQNAFFLNAFARAYAFTATRQSFRCRLLAPAARCRTRLTVPQPKSSRTPAFSRSPTKVFVRPYLQAKSNEQIADATGLIRDQRENRYCEISTEETPRSKEIETSYMGG